VVCAETNTSRWRLLVMTAVWLAGVVAAFAALERYKATPGGSGNTPPRLETTVSDASKRRPELLMFVHPKCPCSRASLSELAETVAQTNGAATVEIVFVVPDGAGPDWQETSLWEMASGIPGAMLVSDEGGRLAKQLGAETSGYVVLYDSNGRLCFRGGITRSRGHLGDNAGRRALCDMLSGQAPSQASSPVFGCPLFGGGKFDDDGNDNTIQTCQALADQP
jgi:hypothetical protein